MPSRLLVGALFLFAAHVQAANRKFLVKDEPALKTVLPFYHTSDELHAKLQDATRNCRSGTATLDTGGAGLDVVRISSKESSGSRPSALFVFGEHARELFSAESAVHFVRSLCGLESSVSEDRARNSLSRFDFVIVPNANPQGRRMVEAGNYCRRTNENGVDLNRNYGNEHRDAASAKEYHDATNAGADRDDQGEASESNPGPEGFSEPETQAIRDLAKSQSRLKIFLSVHTGAYLLGMPFGYTGSETPPHADEMRSILADISQGHCGGNCPYGSLASLIGYKSKGCSIDYVAEDLHVPFSFTWEIYTSADVTAKFTADAAESKADAADPSAMWSHFASRYNEKSLKAVVALQAPQGMQSVEADASALGSPNAAEQTEAKRDKGDRECLKRFNPTDESSFSENLDNWSGAYMDLTDKVAGGAGAKMDKDAASVTSQSKDPYGLDSADSDESSSTQAAVVKEKATSMVTGTDSTWAKDDLESKSSDASSSTPAAVVKEKATTMVMGTDSTWAKDDLASKSSDDSSSTPAALVKEKATTMGTGTDSTWAKIDVEEASSDESSPTQPLAGNEKATTMLRAAPAARSSLDDPDLQFTPSELAEGGADRAHAGQAADPEHSFLKGWLKH